MLVPETAQCFNVFIKHLLRSYEVSWQCKAVNKIFYSIMHTHSAKLKWYKKCVTGKNQVPSAPQLHLPASTPARGATCQHFLVQPSWDILCTTTHLCLIRNLYIALSSQEPFDISSLSSACLVSLWSIIWHESESWTSLAVQWLGLCAFTAKGTGSIPGWRTKILQAMWRRHK